MTTTTFELKITLGNDAMQAPGDVADALADLAMRLRNQPGNVWYDDRGRLRDVNGNVVGQWAVDAVTSA
jgi:hypothetical protein